MRFRKTIKIVPGIKLNVSKSGISTTLGKKGLSVNMGKDGAYLNTGIPGTGIYNRQKIDGGGDTDGQNYDPENETTKQPENEKINAFENKDIPTLKKGLRNINIICVILILLGIISITTIVLPILFFGGALAFFVGKGKIKKRIKELESR